MRVCSQEAKNAPRRQIKKRLFAASDEQNWLFWANQVPKSWEVPYEKANYPPTHGGEAGWWGVVLHAYSMDQLCWALDGAFSDSRTPPNVPYVLWYTFDYCITASYYAQAAGSEEFK